MNRSRPSAPRDRLDVMRAVVMVAAGAWFAFAVVYQLRAAAAVHDFGYGPMSGSGLHSGLAWFAALQGISLVAFVGSVGIYVVLWFEDRRKG